MRLRNVKNKEEILSNSSYLIRNPEDYIGKWKSVFHNDNPIYIEIGMGKGKFIIENAMKYPDINFIGIEKFDSVVAKCLPKIPDGINNLVIVRMDANNIDKVFKNEIERIYLNFSDPWPKNRHAKRRLTSSDFLAVYDKISKGNTHIVQKTDNIGLFAYSISSLSTYGYTITQVSLDLANEDIPNVLTEYEKKFMAREVRINYLDAVKKN